MVVHTESVFGSVVQRMLANMTDVEVIGCDPKDQADLLKTLRLATPDVVLMTRGSWDLSFVSNMLLAQQGNSRIRVIVMDQDDNLVHVYDKGQTTLSATVDLLTLIHGG